MSKENMTEQEINKLSGELHLERLRISRDTAKSLHELAQHDLHFSEVRTRTLLEEHELRISTLNKEHALRLTALEAERSYWIQKAENDKKGDLKNGE